MSAALRLLIVEDFEDDALLLQKELRRGGFDPLTVRRVECADELRAALARDAWDIVVTDYSLPNFSGPDALKVVLEAGCDVPVIIVSGTVNEEIAVECLKGGASDFIAKGKLTRLVPAIRRELREVATRRERSSATIALRDSEDRYKLLFEVSPLPTFVWDVDTLEFVTVNEAALAHFGYSQAEFMRLKLADLWPANERDERVTLVKSMGTQSMRGVSMRHVRSDGAVVEGEVVSQMFEHGSRRARLTVVNDVTERRRLEAQLRQGQKLEAIGQLAGGIAHDFNNMLAAITSYAELAAESLEPDSPVREDIEEIRRAAFRAAGLTRQLLAFSRRQVLQPTVANLNAIVHELKSMLQRTIGEHVELATELAPALGCVRADVGQLEQIAMNLVVNARDAMPDGGTITIRTFDVSLDASNAPHHALPPGEYVAMQVSDTGVGMDDATRARIFEPFFTTKPLGEGTGLGLATVYGIAQQSKGHVSVESAPGRGSTFTLYLPRVEDEVTPNSRRTVSSRPRASETVLLVEDDAALRRVTARVLRAAGYEVLEAEDPEHALSLSIAHPRGIDLLLTDVVMPRGSGPALAAELARRRPETRVLFISGYSEHRGSGNVVPPDAAFLEKPFSPSSLRNKVRATLDREPERAS